MLERDAIQQLAKWKDSQERKPLLLNGARQVGKTWLLTELGNREFDNVAYVNLDGNKVMQEQFDQGYDLARILQIIQIQTKEVIHPHRTLIILDEIQEVPKALTSLKYFAEQRPDLAIAAAGSLLGITMHSGTGFPVGKVDMLDLFPLTFPEYLSAIQENGLRQLIEGGDLPLLSSFAQTLEHHLKNYYFVGGMPEVVRRFAANGNYEEARKRQQVILDSYKLDFSKHLRDYETENILAVWESIPRHLSQENKRFIFGQVQEGARGSQYRSSLTWLKQAGLALNVPRVAKPDIPLRSYADSRIFKMFLVDVGLLGAMAGLQATTILEGNRMFEEFKGALTEQYVCQQLTASGLDPFYWKASKGQAEIDFLVQTQGEVVAIEVKAEENLRAKSLRTFQESYPATKAVRFSMSGYRKQDWLTNVPLYAINNLSLWR